MPQIFHHVDVFPGYGEGEARIVWKMFAGNSQGTFTVLKSHDGINGWHPIGSVVDNNTLIDPHLFTGSKLSESYYQVIRQFDGKRFDSSIVSTFGDITRQQFGVARYIMGLEYKSMRQFTRVAILKMRLFGPPCPLCTDKITGQKVGISLCEICYGTAFEGGYYPAVPSHLRLMTTSPDVKLDRPDGAGTDDPSIVKIRALAFPLLEKEDLIVDVKGDRRFIIDTVDYSYLAGEIPLVADVQAQLLRRNDVRYKLAVT